MRDAIAEFAAATFRPIVAEAVAGFERVAVLTAVLVGCALLAVAAVVGLIAAGATALAPVVGPATATAIGAGVLLIASLAVGLPARRMLISRVAPPARGQGAAPGAAAAPAPPSPAAAPPAKAPALDPTLIVAACAAAVVLVGPWRVLRTARRAVGLVRFATSALAVAQLLRSLGPLLAATRGVHDGSGSPPPTRP